MAFHVGMRVECIDAQDYEWALDKGAIYIVDGVTEFNGDTYLSINCRPGEWMGDRHYKARRFRPLTDRKSEVSFTMGADPESEKWDNRKRVKVRS